MRSPFKFLDAYTLKDKDVFFGREKEAKRLYEMVNQNRLILVYGQSGAGKTSLVECGLASHFDITDWYPIRIRRRDNINHSLQESIGAIIEEDDDDAPNKLSEQIINIYEEYLRPPYLIFDQLEEVFILGDEREQNAFIQSIAELFNAKIACRIIFIIREEYLGHLYNFEQVLPTLFDRRLRVEAMNTTKVKTVLEKSFQKFNIQLEKPADTNLETIINNLSGGKAIIQLPYLQVYLDMFYREDYQRTYGYKERGEQLPPLEFTAAEIKEFGAIDTVMAKFLDFQEKEIQRLLAQKHPNLLDTTVLQIMDAFVSDEGTKRPLAHSREDGQINLDEKIKRLFPPIPSALLSDSFEALEKARIIRFQDDYMELAHDSLAALITEKRGEEQKTRKRLAAALEEYKLSNGKQLLSETQLLGMADTLPQLYLDEETNQFIEASKQKAKADKAAALAAQGKELEQQRQRAEKEQKLREEAEKAQVFAEKNERRAKLRTRLAIAVSVFALVLAGYAYQLYNQTNDLATTNEQLAKKASQGEEAAKKSAQQAQAALAKAQQNEADRVGAQVDDILKRAEKLASKYPDIYQQMRADAARILAAYPDNPELKKRYSTSLSK